MNIEQTAIKTRSRGWNVSMALPKKELAIHYRRILKALGNQTCAPFETKDGFVVTWRPGKNAR